MIKLPAEVVEKLRQIVFHRQFAYQQTFHGPLAKEVLVDLAKFCRAHESTFSQDARLHAVLEGRREVWLRLQNHLKMDSETLWSLYERKMRGGIDG